MTDTLQLKQEVDSLVVLPFNSVTTQVGYIHAVQVAQVIKGKMEEVNQAFDSLISDAHKTHQSIIKKKKEYYSPLKQVYDRIETMLSDYRERDRERQEREQIELQELARDRQQETLLAEAAELEKGGDKLGAESVLAEAINAPAPVVVAQSQVPKVNGSYSRNLPWQFEIVDNQKVKDEYWTPDVDAIAAVVKAKGELAENIVGKGSIRVWRGTRTVIKK